MESYVARQQVREINRKLFANDLIYSGDDKETLSILISNIIQQYNPEDEMASVPTILEIKPNNIDKDTFDKILLLNKDSVIIQVNNDVLADPTKVAVIRSLKEGGYKLIIEINKDDKIFTLAKVFADYIKFDIKQIPEAIADVRNQFSCKKIAYNVNEPEDYMLAETAGINLYEGTYISPSTTIEVDTSEHSEVNFMEIIKLTNDPEVDIRQLSKVVARDSLMSAQIIRLSNSVYFGSRSRIESIENAIIRVGMANLKRWVFLLQFSRNSNVPEELLQTSYHRAVFCERIIKEAKKKDIKTNDAYLIGLFSTLDILTGHTIDRELQSMNLNEVVGDAIIYREGIGGILLNLVKAYEDANFDRVDRYIKEFNINKDKMFRIYFDSLDEVANLWNSLREFGNVN